jgi:hypothetical protein
MASWMASQGASAQRQAKPEDRGSSGFVARIERGCRLTTRPTTSLVCVQMADGRLLVNGAEASTSSLSVRVGHAAPCEVLAVVTPDTSEPEVAQLTEDVGHGVFSGLRLVGFDDIRVVRLFPSLRYLEVDTARGVDLRPIESLDNLRGLHLNSPSSGLDFGCFPLLESFIGDWHADNRNLSSLAISDLAIWNFRPTSGDLRMFADLTCLVNLTITKTTVREFGGIEQLEDLRRLSVSYAPKLTSIQALEVRELGLRDVRLESAKKVKCFVPLSRLQFLRKLMLSACAPMPDLSWLQPLRRLSYFSFVDTNVESGDLSPLLELPSLRYAGTLDKRHYSHKCETLNELLEKRQRAHV